MLNWSYEQNEHPVVIRVPSVPLKSTGIEDKTDYSKLNKYKLIEKGSKVALIGLGNFFELAKETKEELKKQGIDATLINPCFASGLDEELLNNLKENHNLVITLEDGVLDGGFGEKIARFYGNSEVKVLNYGATKVFSDRVPLEKLYQEYRLKKELIIEDVLKNI